MIKVLDPIELEKQIRESVATINDSYANIRMSSVSHPARYYNYSGGMSPQELEHWRDSDTESRNPAYDTLANAILFRLDRLAIGKSVPDFDGWDVNGNAFKPSDFRGKVVAIVFSNTVVQAQQLKGLAEKYVDRPFQLLGVVPARDRNEFEQVTNEPGIQWLTTWDKGRPAPICMKWHHEGIPYAYVIDHQGFIRHHALMMEDLEGLITPLIAEAEKK